MEADYTKRELDMKFEALGEKVDEKHKETKDHIDLLDRRNHDYHLEKMAFLEEIKAQTTKTNGRVTKIESFMYALKWAAGIVVAVIIPLIVYVYTTQLNTVNERLDRQGALIQKK